MTIDSTTTPTTQTTPTTPPGQTQPPPDNNQQTPPPAEFTPDPAKSEAENAAAKEAFEKAKNDSKPPPETPEAKAAREKAEKEAADKAAADKANDTKANPFKLEEIKLPEGFEADKPTQEKFVSLVNKHGIPRHVVSELIALQADATKAASEAGSKLFDDTQAAWQDEVKKDPDIGGDKLPGVLAGIAKMIDQADDPAKLREALDLTGAGNHPVVIKWLNKFSAQFNEPGSVPRGDPGGQGLSAADRIFGKKG